MKKLGLRNVYAYIISAFPLFYVIPYMLHMISNILDRVFAVKKRRPCLFLCDYALCACRLPMR
jgi:hypothetical protein